MFKNEYQGGPFVEIFSAQGKNTGTKWKFFGNPSVIGKEYDKEVKGFVFVLEGSSQTNKMQLPKETKQTLGLIQQFLVLQIYVPLGQDFSAELLITDLGNIKRRLYLSTIHKELSVTPLHAKIPLFMIKRKIWCNLCIDLVAFTSEIFKGAVFQSLDGIIVSANCKLRKIFTLKSNPLDPADDDAAGPAEMIPRACQLNADVPQVTQLLNMNKLRQTEQKYRGRPLTSPVLDPPTNRVSATIRNSKSQDISHIAFGSKVLGPPPLSGRRFTTRTSGEVTKSSIRTKKSCQMPSLEKRTEPVQDTVKSEQSLSPLDTALDQENIEDICDTNQVSPDKDEWIFPHQESSELESSNPLPIACETSGGFSATTPSDDQTCESKQTAEGHADIFTYSSKPRSAPHGKPLNLSSEDCSFSVDLKEDISRDCRGAQMEDDFYGNESNGEDDSYMDFTQETQNLPNNYFISGFPQPVISKEIFPKMPSRSPESRTHKIYTKKANEEISQCTEDSVVITDKANNIQRSLLPTSCLSPIGSLPEPCKETSQVSKGVSTSALRSSISRKSLKEIQQEYSNPMVQIPEYNWKDYQPSNMTMSEMQMLASMKRQQNEELEYNGPSHGLSASQINNCNISISTSSDDTNTWNSCLPAPVNQGSHYQKEMNPLSHSNPRDWLHVFSPPIIPPSQQVAEYTKASTNLSTQGESEGREEDEVLTLLYDPCLNCYFDPETGKYYELA
ncbi:protein CFAP20DC [Candoia aspera]|uniref:protein CFAP20DC n=1 Tax=Candoia aspera TaxID=51853 RepID=UPI002FD7D8BC